MKDPNKVTKQLEKTTYVQYAEDAINSLDKNNKITSSKIRNILTLMNVLYEKVRLNTNAELSDDIYSSVQYVKMKLVYEESRKDGKGVKELLESSELIGHLNGIGRSREKLILVCRYTEALIAYHKYRFGEAN